MGARGCDSPGRPDQIARWVGQHPKRFFVPPYVGGRGWVGTYLDVEQDWDDIAEIIEAAYLEVAPVTLRRAWTERDA